MPRPRPQYLHKEVVNGLTFWYVRIGKGNRIRIRAVYGTPDFEMAYNAAISGKLTIEAKKQDTASLDWLVARYRDSSAWQSLSMATRKQRENILRPILTESGKVPFAQITRKHIVEGRERRKDTPSMARHFIETLRAMFVWAIDASFVDIDPTLNVKAPSQKTDGFHMWTDAEIAQYEAHWPIGTRERLALDLLVYTGLRRGDAVRLGKQHVKNGIIQLKTEKTGEIVTIPMLEPLKKSIEASKTGDLAFIVGERGLPMVKESFGTWFKIACKTAGVKGSAHGLRKAAATRAANNGATVAQLEAIFGWQGGGMAALYTRKADRERLSMGAASMMIKND